MAKGARSRRRFFSRQFRSNPYPIPQPCSCEVPEDVNSKKTLPSEREDWEDATCSVCMDFPHNAVLLLCSSHDNGCRPYMCATSHHHSNCLDLFRKAYTKARSSQHHSVGDGVSPSWSLNDKSEILELACPLCRGQVKGWTVVEPAREYLNNKKRSCMQDGCCFTGTYKELKRHVRSDHPWAKPREVDPEMEEKWRVLEHERERQDVISTIRSSMPRSVVFGDYVIEMTNSEGESEDERAIVEDGEFEGGTHSISRGILYFLLREGARLMRFQDGHDLQDRRGDGAEIPAASAGYSSGGGESNVGITPSQRRAVAMLTVQGQRRRRRRRSREILESDVG
ncbi:hypothetical protein AXF42_Ash010088 [Apostasia shenzhenica]|uniref:Uncharacterized protein n=1 Tax=Apostasia shenzhenica TaxID=1088818 RepID=A0A2I0A9H6_9ASPA|nr:hypothetical protein AXF42_Ash010088 [Apostasia shenzhenica]